MKRFALLLWLALLAALPAARAQGVPAGGAAARQIRVIVFGDSNSDGGMDEHGNWRTWSYISPESATSFPGSIRLESTDRPGVYDLAGLIEAKGATAGRRVSAVNHSMSATGIGAGSSVVGYGPSALDMSGGFTRFQAEVLGLAGQTWNPGVDFARSNIVRANAFTPDTDTYLYIALGTNAGSGSASTQALLLSRLIQEWRDAGHSASRVLIATVPPRQGSGDTYARDISLGILELVGKHPGLRIIDISLQFSTLSARLVWRSSGYYRSSSDYAHYTLPVREWIAEQIVAGILEDYPAGTVAVGDGPAAGPVGFALLAATPNPFNPTTRIGYELPTAGAVTLRVYDVLGRQVATLVDGVQSAGAHDATLDGSGLTSGVYMVRLAAGRFSQTERVVLTK